MNNIGKYLIFERKNYADYVTMKEFLETLIDKAMTGGNDKANSIITFAKDVA